VALAEGVIQCLVPGSLLLHVYWFMVILWPAWLHLRLCRKVGF
jgi:hypothetical protein